MHRLADFYEGKSVFLTGATGYLGAILLETLLRCFPGIRSVYILVRGKRGVCPADRREAIFKRKIFSSLREQNPDVFQKVQVVAGDTTLPNMGMKDEDIQLIVTEVTLVFHVAASISFMRPLRYMLEQNTKALDYVIDFCQTLKHLDALVYTSTAYSNCNRSEIEEQVYRLPFPAQRFLNELKNDSDSGLERLHAQCQPPWPNSYTFSKCLAENLLLEKANDLPVAVVRPSIIVSSWKGALPGYVEEGSGMVDLALAIGKGVVRVIHGNPDVRLDVVPVDVVANSHVAAAWSVATNRSESPLIVNCITGKADITVSSYTYTLLEMTVQKPLPKSFQNPKVYIQRNAVAYRMIALLEHYAPAMVLDSILYVTGKKPRLMKVYGTYEKAMTALYFFLANQWKWHTENLENLNRQMAPEDRAMLPLDLTGFTIDAMAESLPTGAPFYRWEIDNKAASERRKVAEMRTMMTTCIKAVTVTAFVSVSYAILSLSSLKGMSEIGSIFMVN